jgi:hypothetical protein
MQTNSSEALAYYAQPGVMTDPGEQADLLAGLPDDLPGLVQVVQGNLVHIFWAERYGMTLSEEQKQAVQVRPLQAKLERLRLEDSAPLSALRPLEKRQVGNCRDFSLLLAALLRHQGRPARARCGFGAYFIPGHFEDHWVCEVWDAAAQRWKLVDSQLDALQRHALGIPFDPLDVPYDQFILAGAAWQMVQRGRADANNFGIFDLHGPWFILGNVMRDFLALNKVEILPWDGGWGLLTTPLEAPPPLGAELALWERLVQLTLPGSEDFRALRALYEQTPALHAPESLWERQPLDRQPLAE